MGCCLAVAIDPLKYSELSDLEGMVEVCKYTLRVTNQLQLSTLVSGSVWQSVRFDNVFALGDCATTGTMKTSAVT